MGGTHTGAKGNWQEQKGDQQLRGQFCASSITDTQQLGTAEHASTMYSISQSHVLPNTVTCTLPHNHIYSLTQSYVLPLTITSTVSHLLPRNHMNSLTITFTLFHNHMCSLTVTCSTSQSHVFPYTITCTLYPPPHSHMYSNIHSYSLTVTCSTFI